jgi:hypothetical protein
MLVAGCKQLLVDEFGRVFGLIGVGLTGTVAVYDEGHGHELVAACNAAEVCMSAFVCCSRPQSLHLPPDLCARDGEEREEGSREDYWVGYSLEMRWGHEVLLGWIGLQHISSLESECGLDRKTGLVHMSLGQMRPAWSWSARSHCGDHWL